MIHAHTLMLKAKAEEAIRFYSELGNEILKTNMTVPRIDWSLKGKVGGAYRTGNHTIRINLVLLSENIEYYLEQIVPHEVAHACVHAKWGFFRYHSRISPHGQEWKYVMRAFGKSPDRCHNLDVTNATQRTVAREYVYHCGCNEYKLTIIRHRRIQKGAKYTCRHCHKSLEYKGLAVA